MWTILTRVAVLLINFALWTAQAQSLSVNNRQRVVQGPGELELAVTDDGENVVLAVNRPASLDFPSTRNTVFFSGNRGANPFAAALLPGGFHARDPSVTWSGKGKFYLSVMGPTTNAIVAVSTDNGATFQPTQAAPTLKNPPALCFRGKHPCQADQPHIAADRRSGKDELYIVFRSVTPSIRDATGRNIGGPNVYFSGIGCSIDSGATWTRHVVEETVPEANRRGDYPRVTVGSDGFVYVVMVTGRTNRDILLQRYSPCSSGLKPFWSNRQGQSIPSRIAHFEGVHCDAGNTVAGLDRCNSANYLASAMVAVDDQDPKKVIVTFADQTTPGNHDIRRISVNDVTLLAKDAHFPSMTKINHVGVGERYFPWSCTTGGRVLTGWYDRRNKTPSSNDITQYFVGDDQGNEAEISGSADLQCDSGWPTGGEEKEAKACSRQPQMAGFCSGSPARCDLATGSGCPNGSRCVGGTRGAGKFGDYNGLACANGSAYAAWTSGTPPFGISSLPTPPATPYQLPLGVYFARVDQPSPSPSPPLPPSCEECCIQCSKECDLSDPHVNAQGCGVQVRLCRRLNNCGPP